MSQEHDSAADAMTQLSETHREPLFIDRSAFDRSTNEIKLWLTTDPSAHDSSHILVRMGCDLEKVYRLDNIKIDEARELRSHVEQVLSHALVSRQ